MCRFLLPPLVKCDTERGQEIPRGVCVVDLVVVEEEW
jgi:hypothetical protein